MKNNGQDKGDVSPQGFDYSSCDNHYLLYQKGFYQKKKVNVYMLQNKMILSTEAYAKKPKRIIELGQSDLVKWNVEKHEDSVEYAGFLLILRKRDKDNYMRKIEQFTFFGESILLEQLKVRLSKIVFQSRIQDEYIIQAQIGKGNFARVFSARHRITGKKIAVKCFEKEKLKKAEFGYDGLLREIKVMQTISDHPHLIQFQGCYEGEHTLYLAMDIVEGNSLYSEIKNLKSEKFSMQQIRMYMKQILTGVQYYQSFGIMHRDLKPENIMFSSKTNLDNLVIVDFGFAEFESAEKFIFKKCGTPGYAAPEIVNFKEDNEPNYDKKCDMFSVGVIFHTLLFHKSLFFGTKFNEVLKKNRECNIDFSAKLYESTSKEALSLLKKLLEKNPAERISSNQALEHSFFQEEDFNSFHSFCRVKGNSFGGTTSTFTDKSKEVQEKQISEIEGNPEKTTPTGNSQNPNKKKIHSHQSISSCNLAGHGMNSFFHNSHENDTSFIHNGRPVFHRQQEYSPDSKSRENQYSLEKALRFKQNRAGNRQREIHERQFGNIVSLDSNSLPDLTNQDDASPGFKRNRIQPHHHRGQRSSSPNISTKFIPNPFTKLKHAGKEEDEDQCQSPSFNNQKNYQFSLKKQLHVIQCTDLNLDKIKNNYRKTEKEGDHPHKLLDETNSVVTVATEAMTNSPMLLSKRNKLNNLMPQQLKIEES